MLNARNREVTVKHVLGALLGAVTLLGSAPSIAQTTLTIATVNNSDMIRMQALTNEFTAKNPDVTVKWVTLEENVLRQRVTTDIATKGGQFDVLTIGTYEVPIWAKKNWLIALDNLGPDYDIATHFTPKYRPWRQRIAFIPDGDLFQGIKSGKASVVTDEIDRFTDKGILLKSGQELEADIIITATGFNLNVLGDIDFEIDGKPLDFAETVTYRGMMFTGVPNMAWVFGYFRASWTLRTDLVADFVCRLLAHMKNKGARKVVPALRPQEDNMPLQSWIDPENFNPGYLMRDMHLLPKRGDKPEWQHSQDYWAEKDEFTAIDLDDAAFVYD